MPIVTELEERIAERARAAQWSDAADALVRGYGPEIHGFLCARFGDHAHGDDAFSLFTEDIWRTISAFRGEASYRTWAYAIARRAAARHARSEGARRARVSPDDDAVDAAVAAVRSSTAAFQKSDVKDRMRELREKLTPDERELLVLRIDRDLDWLDIARICRDDDDHHGDAKALAREAAALRKRFERTKARLRALAKDAGLISG